MHTAPPPVTVTHPRPSGPLDASVSTVLAVLVMVWPIDILVIGFHNRTVPSNPLVARRTRPSSRPSPSQAGTAHTARTAPVSSWPMAAPVRGSHNRTALSYPAEASSTRPSGRPSTSQPAVPATGSHSRTVPSPPAEARRTGPLGRPSTSQPDRGRPVVARHARSVAPPRPLANRPGYVPGAVLGLLVGFSYRLPDPSDRGRLSRRCGGSGGRSRLRGRLARTRRRWSGARCTGRPHDEAFADDDL